MMETSYKVFCANQLKDHFLKYDKYNNKLIFTEHPLLKRLITNSKIITKKKDMSIIYSGVFYRDTRNPSYFLKLISLILSELNAKIHLYSAGDCENIVKKFVDMFSGKIIEHGFVTKEKVNNAILKSDILINIGNIDNSQLPSKIFEYMSTGKPIIHFYNNPEDINLKILADYPLCLCLKQDKNLLKDNANKFIKFCIESKGKAIKFEVIEKIFYYATPRYIANMIDNIINF